MNRREFLRGTAALGAVAVMADPVWAWSPTDAATTDLIAPIRRAMLSRRADAEDLSLDRLGRRLRAAWRLRQEGRYEPLAQVLPALIIDAGEARRSLRGQDQLRATNILTHTYNATSSALKVLGSTPLALVAADRALEASTSLDSPALVAASAYRLANVFLPAGYTSDAAEVTLDAAARLEPFASRSVTDLATWGSLTLTAATAHAQAGDSAGAWQLFGEANTAGRQLGHDHADLHTIFGPTSVAMTEVQIATELGNGREAVRRSEVVALDQLPAALLERRSHYLMNLARGHALVNDDAAALAQLLAAEKIAGDDVHRSNIGRDLVGRMLTRERRSATSSIQGECRTPEVLECLAHFRPGRVPSSNTKPGPDSSGLFPWLVR